MRPKQVAELFDKPYFVVNRIINGETRAYLPVPAYDLPRGACKFTHSQVREIRTKAVAGVMQKDLALEYCVSAACIMRIVNRRTYASVD